MRSTLCGTIPLQGCQKRQQGQPQRAGLQGAGHASIPVAATVTLQEGKEKRRRRIRL